MKGEKKTAHLIDVKPEQSIDFIHSVDFVRLFYEHWFTGPIFSDCIYAELQAAIRI